MRSDGRLFLELMEVVSDVKLAKPARGNMRIHKIQNLNTVFDFVKGKGVKLVGIGAEGACAAEPGPFGVAGSASCQLPRDSPCVCIH